MAIRRLATVVDRDGISGRLHHITLDADQRPIARVWLSNGSHVNVPFELFEHEEGGGYRLPARWRDFTVSGRTVTSIPIVKEEVRVAVRPAPEQRLRIRRRTVNRPKLVEVPIMRERIAIDRVAVDRIVAERPAPRREGDVLIIPRVEEEIVIQRRLRLREELRIRVVREQHIHRETVQLRDDELDIDSVDEPQPTDPTKRKGA